ncbi:hypothetical protein ACFLWN_00985 [Chloroflexota bacterium]
MESVPLQDFIPRNRDFWAQFTPQRGTEKVLVEEPTSPLITHGNGIFTIVLNQARSFTPVWLDSPDWDMELVRSYVPTAESVTLPVISWFQKLGMMLVAAAKFLVAFFTGDILAFSYDGVRYGDIVYDTYLQQEQLATVKRINLKIACYMYGCIRRHELIRRVLRSDHFAAVLVAHQVGIAAGVMLRTALRYGYKAYLRKGHHQTALRCYQRPEEIYDYELKPSPEDIERVLASLGGKLDEVFQAVLEKQVSGAGTGDGQFAFSRDLRYYRERGSFARDFKLDAEKKNVFIMLHAFNDFPHSHFQTMLFRDYYDWFRQTLNFAHDNKLVNWIFKQHPSVRFYPTRDVSFADLFARQPENVVYLGEEEQIDTRSLVHCADLVITCLGSPGFELPAMGGIPSVTAGDSFYTGLGFTLEPPTQLEYFTVLGNAQNLERLTPEQQQRARAAFICIYHFLRVPLSACPILSLQEEMEPAMEQWYWGKVLHLNETEKDKIIGEIESYIRQVAEPEFKRLTSVDSYHLGLSLTTER